MMGAILKCEEPSAYKHTAFVPSDMVEVHSGEKLDIKMQYPLLGMTNAEKTCYLRKEAYEHLMKAADQLPDGYRFRIWDAWRPFALQKELYEVYYDKIVQEFKLENRTQEEREGVIRKFVSDPVADIAFPPVHTTGGAIDLTILDECGRELDMGSAFDEFTEKTHTAYYEEGTKSEIRENRRLLYGIMTGFGFTNLPSEWWHYDYGDRFWAFYNAKPAMYKGIFTREEIIRGEL